MLNRLTLERIDTLVAEYRRLAAEHPAALEQIALAELPETVHQSNAIENSTLTLEDTERILAGFAPAHRHDLREIYEARNLAHVTQDLLGSDTPLTIDAITRWHGFLLRDIRDDVAGRFRQGDEWVRVGTHLGANPAFVPDLVASALERYEQHQFDSDLEAIAWFHCEFEIIHPFVDGNGRIGRALMNKQLHDWR